MLNKVLVTGADGFIGSHLVEHLVREGRSVRALVLYNSFDSWGWLDHLPEAVKAAIEVVPGDVRDPDSVAKAVRGCEGVAHLAALISIPYSYEAPESFVDTNLRGTLNVVRAARDLGAARVVQVSSSEVYGTAIRVPIAEDHPLRPQSPYAASKVGADQMALAFHRSFGVPVAVVRPFNTYGPRQSARAVIPTVITQLAAGAGKVRLGATHPTRDFSFVADTAAGLAAAMDAPAAVGEVVNLGSGFEVSIGEAAALIAATMGREIEIETDPARLRPPESEVERLLADTAKAERLLGFKPAFAGREGLKRGLARTIEWFSRPENLAFYKVGRYAI